MLLHVATCYYMLSHVTTCYYRLLHVITSYYMNMLLTDIKCNLLLSTDQQMAKPFPLDTRREPETMMWYRNVLNLFTSQGLLGKWATPFQSISSQGCPDIVLPCFTQPNPPFLLGQASITTYGAFAHSSWQSVTCGIARSLALARRHASFRIWLTYSSSRLELEQPSILCSGFLQACLKKDEDH